MRGRRCFYARRALELAVQWLYEHDAALKLPYRRQSERADSRTDVPADAVGRDLRQGAESIKDLGNLAVHSRQAVRQFDALTATKELFHVMFWLARTYARGTKPRGWPFIQRRAAAQD